MNESITRRTRTEVTEEEIQIHQNAISSSIKRDFLAKEVSYVNTKELTYLLGRARKSKNFKTELKQKLLDEFNAVSVDVSKIKTAIVKCLDE